MVPNGKKKYDKIIITSLKHVDETLQSILTGKICCLRKPQNKLIGGLL